jgi:hypothetical protein
MHILFYLFKSIPALIYSFKIYFASNFISLSIRRSITRFVIVIIMLGNKLSFSKVDGTIYNILHICLLYVGERPINRAKLATLEVYLVRTVNFKV